MIAIACEFGSNMEALLCISFIKLPVIHIACLIYCSSCNFSQVVGAADEVIESVDTDELAKCLSLKTDPEDEGAEVSF